MTPFEFVLVFFVGRTRSNRHCG